MSNIGLYDADMVKYIHIPFNLELMKLSSYYKGKMILTAFSPSFIPDKFTKYIIRKDYNDGDFPLEYYQSNIECGGYAFSGPQYKSFDIDIENIKPDRTIYEKFSKEFCNNKTNSELFKTMMHAEHLRASLDGYNINPNYEKQLYNNNTRCFMFHDWDLNSIEDSRLLVAEFLKCRNSDTYIGTKFPIKVNNSIDLLKWCGIKVMQNNFCIEYNGIMEDEVFCEFLEKQKETTFASQLNYNVAGACSSEDEFLEKYLPQIFNQVTFSRNNRYKILLKYEPKYSSNEKIKKIIQLFNAYNNNIFNVKINNELQLWRALECETMYSFVKSFSDTKKYRYTTYFLNKTEAREIFMFIREKNYELFTKFYNQSKVKLKGGKLVNDTRIYTGTDRPLELSD